jgi:hypothetical protein
MKDRQKNTFKAFPSNTHRLEKENNHVLQNGW